MPSETKIIIGMPTYGKMTSHTTFSLVNTIMNCKLVQEFMIYESCDIVTSRTWLVNEAVKRGATHLLFVDSDMVFQPGSLEKLLASKKEVIGVKYHQRGFPLAWTHGELKDVAESETEIYKVRYAGTGFLLIDLSIIPKLEGAWFSFGRDSQGKMIVGEDVWFCDKAREAGIDTWIDPTVKVGHRGEYTY